MQRLKNRDDFRVKTAIVVIASVLSLFGILPQATAQQPTDWTISQTIIGPAGEDLPLRIGRKDGVRDGFGILHIQDGHGGFVPAAAEIEAVLHGAPSCKNGLNGGDKKVKCIFEINGKSMKVIATERVDPGSGDGRPVGIITAYYP